jgi:hypothetical protein
MTANVVAVVSTACCDGTPTGTRIRVVVSMGDGFGLV